MPPRVVEQIKMAESVEAAPNDPAAQFALIDSLIDRSTRQFLILMHETAVEIPFEGPYLGSPYETGNEHGWWSSGHMSGHELLKRLEGTGLVEFWPKGFVVRVTEYGKSFAQWLIDSNRKAEFLSSKFGGWGKPVRPDGLPPSFIDPMSGTNQVSPESAEETKAEVRANDRPANQNE